MPFPSYRLSQIQIDNAEGALDRWEEAERSSNFQNVDLVTLKLVVLYEVDQLLTKLQRWIPWEQKPGTLREYRRHIAITVRVVMSEMTKTIIKGGFPNHPLIAILATPESDDRPPVSLQDHEDQGQTSQPPPPFSLFTEVVSQLRRQVSDLDVNRYNDPKFRASLPTPGGLDRALTNLSVSKSKTKVKVTQNQKRRTRDIHPTNK